MSQNQTWITRKVLYLYAKKYNIRIFIIGKITDSDDKIIN